MVDAFELRVLARPASTTALVFIRMEFTVLQEDVDDIFDVCVYEQEHELKDLSENTIIKDLFKALAETQSDPTRARGKGHFLSAPLRTLMRLELLKRSVRRKSRLRGSSYDMKKCTIGGCVRMVLVNRVLGP